MKTTRPLDRSEIAQFVVELEKDYTKTAEHVNMIMNTARKDLEDEHKRNQDKISDLIRDITALSKVATKPTPLNIDRQQTILNCLKETLFIMLDSCNKEKTS